jgi:hypothetical protein
VVHGETIIEFVQLERDDWFEISTLQSILKLRRGGLVEALRLTLVTERTTMSLIGILLTLGGLGFLCWLLFTLAIYALPVFAGLWIAGAAYHSGAGYVGAFVVALVAGVAIFGLGQFAFATARAPILRISIALFYSVPALVAGYQATLGLARIGTPSGTWCQIFAAAGGLAVGAAAWLRLTRFEVARFGRTAHDPRRLAGAGTTKGI